MDKAVYLIGTWHRFQGRRQIIGAPTKHQLHEFKTFLCQAIRDWGICSIAEELNTEILTNFARPDLPPKKSIPYLAADELKRRHKYCDPDSARCAELGITAITEDVNDENNKKREAEWLSQLATFGPFPCLFVLGSAHICTFIHLLKTSGFRPIILEEEWFPTDWSR